MDHLQLDQQLCFPVYALSRHMMALYRPFLLRLNLTYPQYLVMMVLWEHREVSVKELGGLLWLDSGTLTPLLKRMEEHGQLTRSRSSADERVVRVRLTEKGLALKEQVLEVPEKFRAQLATDDAQLLQLRDQLKQLLSISSQKCYA